MSSIYILSDAGKLTKTDETIVFTQLDGTSTILFPFKTKQLILIGSVSISAQVFTLLSKYKIPVVFLSRNGNFNSKLEYGESKNVFLRQKQYRILDNQKASLEIARSIVTGKIRNQISFVQRIKRKTKTDDSNIKSAIDSMKQNLKAAQISTTLEKLRGIEGIASRNYFKVFGTNILPEWAEFKTRSRNPPKSNVNALLSFLYTLLMYRVESAIETQGLDPMAGNLHLLNYGKSALVFDLMEEFRTPIADSICCSLFNLGQLTKDDFETKEFTSDSEDFPIEKAQENSQETNIQDQTNIQGVLLTKSGIKKTIQAFEEKLESMVLYLPENKKIGYQTIIFKQAEHYKRVISGEETEYQSFYFK